MVPSDLLLKLERYKIASRIRMHSLQAGEKASRLRGTSPEFADYRAYQQGDDIRRIDWNVYARSERLYMKLFHQEESRPVYFLVDASASMNFGSPSKFSVALSIAQALSYIALKNYDRPRILILRGSGYETVPIGSVQSFFSASRNLDSRATSGDTHLNAVLRKLIKSGLPNGSFFLLSDFYSQDGFDAVKLFGAGRSEINCMLVLTPAELYPDSRGDLKLEDSEIPDQIEVSISPEILKRYKTRLAAFQQNIQSVARFSGPPVITIQTGDSLHSILLEQLTASGWII